MTTEAKKYPIAVPIVVLIIAMISFQLGAVLAKGLFPIAGVAGATAMRVAIASVILCIAWRPWRMRFTRQQARTVIVYGVSMGWMNFFFYLSLSYVPLGIAVALEFVGPLAVALFASRRALDFLWILMAALGLLALLPLGAGAKPLPPLGIIYGFAAGGCWALYIIYGRKAGVAHGGQSTALGTLIGAFFIVPIGLAQSGSILFSPALLPAACGIAVLSSALPYSLEMFALPRLPTRTFGVLMSLDPALGALSGLCFLGEQLTLIQWVAIASIVVASAGSAGTVGSSSSELLPE